MNNDFCKPLAGFLALSMLSACGIDQGGSPQEIAPQTLVVYGPITDFGSIVLNGERLDTTNALIMADGNIASEADLRVGHIVRVIGIAQGTSRTALVVTYQENLRGDISAIDTTAGTFQVLNHTVQTDAETRFDIGQGGTLADLNVGMRVEISALEAPDGVVHARYVGSAAAQPLEVSGAIDTVDVSSQTFTVGNLTVDYSQTNLLDVPGGIPAVGVIAEIEATQFANGVLVADLVRNLDSEPGLFGVSDTDSGSSALAQAGAVTAAGLASNFFGFISATNLPDEIELAGVRIALGPNTIIAGGSSNDLQVGRLVLVVGPVQGLGIVDADRITLF